MLGGFAHNYRADINELKSTLQDRYEYDGGFSVIKEIIQNAEDAGAKTLRMGWCGGLPSAAHPLLRGPAVFFINDRNLSVLDAEAIRALNLSAKASKSWSIGRFGLGLKSVFHLGEMFFYLSPPDLAFADLEYPATGFLNPWHAPRGGGPHPEWSGFTEADQQAMRVLLAGLLPTPEFFCLYVPLRDESVANPIVEHAFALGDGPMSSFSDPSLPGEIGMMLPMLRSLRSVDAWYAPCAGIPPDRLFRVNLVNESQSSTMGRDPDEQEGEREFSGVVELRTETQSVRLKYAGLECLRWSDELLALNNSSYWPKSEVYGADAAEPVSCLPHAAAYFASTECDGECVLQVQRSVFLPLDEPPKQSGPAVRVICHGCQFVDAGRRSIKGLGETASLSAATNEDEVRQCWNQIVDDSLLHPLVPMALDAFVRRCEVDEGLISSLTDGLRRSELLKHHRQHVCARHQWARVLGTDGSHWQLLGPDTQVFALPRPPEGLELSDLFPTLFPLADGFIVAFEDDPAITKRDRPLRLPHDHLCSLLEGMQVDEELIAEHVVYVAALLSSPTAAGETTRVGAALLPILRVWIAAFMRQEVNDESAQEALRALVSLVPSDQRLALDVTRLDPDWSAGLAATAEHVLMMPAALSPPDDPGTGVLSEHDARKLLEYIAARTAVSSERERVAFEALISEVLSACPDAHEMLGHCADEPLLNAAVLAGAQQRNAWLSLEQLCRARDERRLFVAETVASLQPLTRAVLGLEIVRISRRLGDLLGWAGEQSSLPLSVVGLLGQYPPLAPADARRQLLYELVDGLRSDPNQATISAVRYLLHETQAAEDPHPLPLLCSADDGGVWGAIAGRAMEEGRAAPADGALADEVPNTLWQLLNLWRAGRQDAEHLVELIGPNQLSGEHLSKEHVRQLLLEVEDVSLLQAMRIHRDLSGNWVPIRPGSYWQGRFSPEAAMPPGITLLEQDTNEVARARQRRLATELDPEAAIQEALNQDEPGRYWRLIAEALGQLPDVPQELRTRLRDTAWLPTRFGMFVAPGMVLANPRLSCALLAKATALSPEYVSQHDLGPDVLSDDLRPSVRRLWMTDQATLRKAAELLAQAPEHRLGPLAFDPSEDTHSISVEAIQTAFQDGPPGLEVVCEILSTADDRSAPEILRVFCKNVGEQRLLELLARVQLRCQEQSSARAFDPVLWPLLQAYVTALLAVAPPCTLASIKLPNRLGEWRPATELCVGGVGVAPAHCVHKELAHSFAGSMAAAAASAGGPPGGAERNAAQVLADYFRGWEAHVERESIGALLGILGDDDAIRELAQSYLGNHSLTWLRANLQVGVETRTAEAVMQRQRVAVTVQEDDRITLTSLAGTPFVGSWEGHRDHIFAVTEGDRLFGTRNESGKRVSIVRLQGVDPGLLGGDTASEMLARSFDCLLEGLYREYKMTAAPGLWDGLSESSQLSIRIVQQRILAALPISRGQLGLGKDTEIGQLLAALDSLDRQILEAQDQARSVGASGRSGLKRWLDELGEQHKNLRSQLEQSLNDNPTVHKEMLSAVRKRVRSYQYQPDSIPFELFQNADDALVELEKLGGGADGVARANGFVIQTEDNVLRFLHCGRKINQFAYGEGSGQRDLGFADDLQKMLTLSGSDKNQAGDDSRVTGKFGLGFKSVFQVSNRPRMVSGTLAIQVRGGMWPRLLPDERRAALHGCLTTLGDSWNNGTVIEVPLSHGNAQEVLGRFQRLLQVQLAFARRIRHCRVYQDGECLSTSWRATDLVGVEGASTAPIAAADGGAKVGLLLSPEGARGAVLFGLDFDGFVSLGDHVPAVWATTPTREPVGLGLALNGEFQVDIGRSQLAEQHGNVRIAHEVSDGLGKMLCQLYDAMSTPSGWAQAKEQLGLAHGTEPGQIWASLWAVVTQPFRGVARSTEHSGVGLLRSALWGNAESTPSGVAALYVSVPAVPSGLPGDYGCLLRLRDLQWFATESLREDGVLEALAEWDLMRELVPRGTVLAESHFRSLVELLPHEVAGVRQLALLNILEWELQRVGFAVDPGLAARLGSVVTRKRVDGLAPEERESVRALLEKATFRSNADSFCAAGDLLIGHDDEGADTRDIGDRLDEQARAGFAPPRAVLSSEYGRDALVFFLACRPELRANAVTLAKWVADAQGADRIAAMRYLVDGQLNREVAAQLRQAGVAGRWFDPLGAEAQPLLLQLGAYPVAVLQGLLHRTPPQPPSPPASPTPTISVGEIAQWWGANRQRLRAKYLDEVWGDSAPVISLDDDLTDRSARHEWMKLFLMGMFHSLGRSRVVQHRAFLGLLEERGWLDTVSELDPSPGEWERLLDDYIDSSETEALFYHWMRQFVGMRWLSRYLEDYVEGVRALNLHHAPRPELIVNQHSSSALQGTGHTCAPPLDRVLGVGQHFVFRELARTGLINNRKFDGYCFLPTAGVRQLALQLGCTRISLDTWQDGSRQLHAFLEDAVGTGDAATFGRNFDIPLQCLCRWPDLRRDLGIPVAEDVQDEDGWED